MHVLTILGVSAALMLAAVAKLRRRRRAHEPRALGLVLALPAEEPPDFAEDARKARRVMEAAANWRVGPIAMPVAGPGRPRLG